VTRRELLKRTALAVSVPDFSKAQTALPGTAPLTWDDDLATRMMTGAHQFIDRLIAESPSRRATHWHRDFSSPAAYERSIAPNRERFRRIIGAIDPRVAPAPEHSSRARWQVLDRVTGEGCYTEPTGTPKAGVVLLPDAGQAPEQLLPLAAAFARVGCRVIVPALVNRATRIFTLAGTPARSTQTNREWIYRQAFHMGRHIIGYEVQNVLAALDWLHQESALPLGVMGTGEGGLIALYSAALDPRIQVTLVSEYFNRREALWREPIDRNIWGLLREFGDAEIATLIAPRTLIVASPPSDRDEFDRIGTLLPPNFQTRHWAAAPEALTRFTAALGIPSIEPAPTIPAAFDDTRQYRQMAEMQEHVQALLRVSDRTRNQFFLYKVAPEFIDETWNTVPAFPLLSPQKVSAQFGPYRDYFWNEVMGRIEEPLLPPNPRSRQILSLPKSIGYDVVLDVWKELFAWGILLIPKDLKPGERRPVVVCQHGRGGVPLDTVQGDSPFYHDYAQRLAAYGFIVFSPHILFRNEEKYRTLYRKANTIKASLFSLIAAQHQQILNWLGTLPFVDSARIGFYGLSFGGETAMRIPSLLPGYALSICSADFNNWTRKVASADQPWSFLYSDEYETPTFDMGNTFDHAELAYLISPRPFMVERGREDRVGRDEWVAYEYAKVSHFYARLGLSNRTAIEYFEGGHTIHGEETFHFLSQHLNWPLATSPR
jgi:dienelactone hydrolase